MSKNIDVSVFCLVFNHEPFIRQCLDGFIAQQGVAFEVIVHDDASNDGSSDIIKEYAEKYPEIIKPVFQSNNQASKDVDIVKGYMYPRASGKYIAFCEGDDYWSDPLKLKKQFDALEENTDCTIAVHKTILINRDGSDTGNCMPNVGIQEGKILYPEFISLYEEIDHQFHTSSFYIRASIFRKIYEGIPRFMESSDVGDIPLLLYCASAGNLYYIDECMSCYRVNSGPTSQSYQVGRDRRLLVKHYKSMLQTLSEYEEFIGWEDALRHTKNRYRYKLYLCESEYLKALKLLLKCGKNIKLTVKLLVYHLLDDYFPIVIKKYKRHKHNA